MENEIRGMLVALECAKKEWDSLSRKVTTAQEDGDTTAAELYSDMLLGVEGIINTLKVKFCDIIRGYQTELSDESLKIINLLDAQRYILKSLVECNDRLDKEKEGSLVYLHLKSMTAGLNEIFVKSRQEVEKILNRRFEVSTKTDL